MQGSQVWGLLLGNRRSSDVTSISVGGGAMLVEGGGGEEAGSARYRRLWRKAIMEHILNNRLVKQEKMMSEN